MTPPPGIPNWTGIFQMTPISGKSYRRSTAKGTASLPQVDGCWRWSSGRRSTQVNPVPPLDTRRDRAENTPMKGKSRREQIASMSKAERLEFIPLARKVRADAISW